MSRHLIHLLATPGLNTAVVGAAGTLGAISLAVLLLVPVLFDRISGGRLGYYDQRTGNRDITAILRLLTVSTECFLGAAFVELINLLVDDWAVNGLGLAACLAGIACTAVAVWLCYVRLSSIPDLEASEAQDPWGR